MSNKKTKETETVLETALRKMEERINNGFESLVKRPRAAIQSAHDSARNSSYGYEGVRRGTGPSSAIDFHVSEISSLESEKKAALSWVAGIRGFQELIEAGLMPVAEAIRTVSAKEGNISRLAAAKLMAEPGHIRLNREGNKEINAANNAADDIETTFGLVKGSFGRTTSVPSDSIQDHDADGTKRF